MACFGLTTGVKGHPGRYERCGTRVRTEGRRESGGDRGGLFDRSKQWSLDSGTPSVPTPALQEGRTGKVNFVFLKVTPISDSEEESLESLPSGRREGRRGGLGSVTTTQSSPVSASPRVPLDDTIADTSYIHTYSGSL